MGSEILQRQRVVRQRMERRVHRAKGRLGGKKLLLIHGVKTCETHEWRKTMNTKKPLRGQHNIEPRKIRIARNQIKTSRVFTPSSKPKIITRLRTALLGKRDWNRGIAGLNRKKDSPETSTRLSVIPWGATRIPVWRAGRIRGYSNRENRSGASL